MPANFLDVGGGASPEKIANAFRIVLEDPHVRAVLLNIFAGINRCDWVAQAIVQENRGTPGGTNLEQGRSILKRSGLSFIRAQTLADKAHKAVQALQGATA